MTLVCKESTRENETSVLYQLYAQWDLHKPNFQIVNKTPRPGVLQGAPECTLSLTFFDLKHFCASTKAQCTPM